VSVDVQPLKVGRPVLTLLHIRYQVTEMRGT
jgi:hypothetical protein